MRLDEITNSNVVWGKLSGINLSIDNEYLNIISLLKMLIALRSRHRASTFMHTITTFENNLTTLLTLNFSGYPNQRDMKKFKNKCRKMLSNIQYLKSQLP